MHNIYDDTTDATILNLTQHQATPDQVAAGVVEPHQKKTVQALLTFASLPSREEIDARAAELAAIAEAAGATEAMIGGAPYLMAPLERALIHRNIRPLYSFTERSSEEVEQADGSTRKISVFRHVGFVEA